VRDSLLLSLTIFSYHSVLIRTRALLRLFNVDETGKG
jgi:hypothetical protein